MCVRYIYQVGAIWVTLTSHICHMTSPIVFPGAMEEDKYPIVTLPNVGLKQLEPHSTETETVSEELQTTLKYFKTLIRCVCLSVCLCVVCLSVCLCVCVCVCVCSFVCVCVH